MSLSTIQSNLYSHFLGWLTIFKIYNYHFFVFDYQNIESSDNLSKDKASYCKKTEDFEQDRIISMV